MSGAAALVADEVLHTILHKGLIGHQCGQWLGHQSHMLYYS